VKLGCLSADSARRLVLRLAVAAGVENSL